MVVERWLLTVVTNCCKVSLCSPGRSPQLKVVNSERPVLVAQARTEAERGFVSRRNVVTRPA